MTMLFLFGIIIGVVIGAASVYFWLDYTFSKAVEEVLDGIANQREGALDE